MELMDADKQKEIIAFVLRSIHVDYRLLWD